MKIACSLFLLAGLAVGGCAKPAIAGSPVTLSVHEDANPDVIWLIRPIATDRADAGAVTLYGLFACYRSTEPGPPQCFLAQTAGTEKQLVWPDDPDKYKINPPR